MEYIEVKGARTHNLKGFDLKIPKNQITVILGPSGSGKSSLAMDTLYAEGSRRYLESLNFQARTVMGKMAQTEVDQIIGLSPSVELKALRIAPGSRSTVGTLTEVDALLRTLFYKGAQSRCPHCDQVLKAWTIAEVVDEILKAEEGSPCYVLAPREAKAQEKEQWIAQGMIRAMVEGEMSMVEDLEWEGLKQLDLVVDRFKVFEKHRTRIWEAVETAFQFSQAGVSVQIGTETRYYSSYNQCEEHQFNIQIQSRKSFSFNSSSACSSCQGLGEIESEDSLVGRLPTCKSCQGRRLDPIWESVTYHGLSLSSWSMLDISQLSAKVDAIVQQDQVADWEISLLKEIQSRLSTLLAIGLSYLHLYRSASSLSSGEYQRIRIATQIGSRMSGICYFLDEPLSGLHLQDQKKIWEQIELLKAQGNTIVLVEHNRYAIQNAQYIVELGPGSGQEGGQLLYQGQEWFEKGSTSLGHWQSSLSSSQDLASELTQSHASTQVLGHPVQIQYQDFLSLKASEFHLYPGAINVIGGVSGSGKSTLLNEVLIPYFRAEVPGPYGVPESITQRAQEIPIQVKGLQPFQQLIRIDSRGIRGGRRSSPASLTGMMDSLRKLFAKLPESKVRGYTAARFSLNKKGGRCEHCLGEGVKKVELSILPDSHEVCESCQGGGFNGPTLEVLFKGYNLAQILNIDVATAARFFRDIPELSRTLETLILCGLSHLPLGMSAHMLSGGEMQRLKLARELKSLRPQTQAWIFMDEPSRGLFFHEVQGLLSYWRSLTEQGHTIVLVDHHPDVIAAADHLEVMGPGSGPDGGAIIDSTPFRQEVGQWLSEL